MDAAGAKAGKELGSSHQQIKWTSAAVMDIEHRAAVVDTDGRVEPKLIEDSS